YNYPTPPIHTLIPYTTLFRSYNQSTRNPPPFKTNPRFDKPGGSWQSRLNGQTAARSWARPEGATKKIFTNSGQAAKSHVNRVARSEEHTSELQSRGHLVCRIL